MIVEFLDNSKLRKTIGSVDPELAKTVTSEGFSCKDVRAYLHTLTINQVKSVLEKCLKFIESEGTISEAGNDTFLDKDLRKIAVTLTIVFLHSIHFVRSFDNTVLH